MLTFVDLFCGGGLGARGAVNAGRIPLLAVDSWDVATKTYKHNFKNADTLTSPIEQLDPKKISKAYAPNVLLTSPECTSHSIARGSKPGCERSKETAIGILPWIEALAPRWVIVENVNRMRQWDRHIELVQTLEDSGYEVSDLRLNSADFGVAQARQRLFLIADKEGTTVTEASLKASTKSKRRNVRELVDWTNKFQSTPLYKEGRAQATIDRAERAMSELGRNEPFLIVYYGSDYAGGWQSLDAPLRTVTTLDRFGLVTWKDQTPFLRMLQPEELILAMGAGKSHQLPFGTRRDKVRICGNGVCAPVMEAIFRHIGNVEYQSAKLQKAS